jgi:LuxR family maltose regulon positive regulatory protein
MARSATKFRAPRGPDAVERPRLEAHAQDFEATQVTVVAAGAGFGKTTILRAWASRLAPRADIAWLSLDETDAEAGAFAVSLYAALQRAGVMGSERGALRTAGFSPADLGRALAATLVHATEERDRRLVVFLDDFHAVAQDAGVRELVGNLLRGLPPRAHVAIASRSALDFSPLVKLRAERLVADFTQDDLRFTSEEAAALLTDCGQRIDDEASLAELLERTEGWAMALRLSTQGTGAARGAAASFDDGSERSLFAYLAEEVLRAQPPALRAELLDCSTFRTLDAATVARVLQCADGRAMLERFIERNLYVEPLGEGRYRFHQLFRSFLLETFARENGTRLRELQRRYARDLEERGELVAAVEQYLEAGDFISAADHVTHAGFAIRYGAAGERVASLLRAIPDEIKRERPRLLQFEASAMRRSRDFAGAARAYARARVCALELEEYGTACVCAVEEGMLADDLRAGGHGTFERSVALFDEALRYAERTGERRATYTKMASLAMGLARAARFEYDLAAPFLAEAERLQKAAPAQRSDILTTIAEIWGWQGLWQRALECAELAEDLLRSSDGTYLEARALKVQAKAHLYVREDAARTLALAERAVELERSQNQFDDLADAYVVLARAHLAQSVPAVGAAHAALDEATRRQAAWPNSVTAFDIAAARAETHLLVGELREARREIDAAAGLAAANGDARQLALAIFLQGLLDSAGGRGAAAVEAFERAERAFAGVRDVFHRQLCDIAACGAHARAGTLDGSRLSALLNRLDEAGATLALRSAPRSAQLVLAWSLRYGVDEERASAFLADAAALAGDGEFEALALDRAATPAARVRAIGHLAREQRATRRDLFERLARDAQPAVAAAAATALTAYGRKAIEPLALRVVGPLQVRIGATEFDERDSRWSRRKAVDMLRALALAEGPVAKTELIGHLWPGSDPANAETSLRVTLHALRRALEPDVEGGGHYVAYDGTTLQLRRDALASVDARDALAAFRHATFARARKAAAEADSLYARTIDLLAAAPPEESSPEWLLPHVRTWRRTLVAALCAGAELRLREAKPAAARGYVERALTIDPLDEDAVCIALDVALRSGDTARARAVFVEYKRRLRAEIGAAPGPAVLAAYGEVLRARALDRTTELTERELEILALIGRGRSNKQIATELGLSAWTVNGHVTRILRKLQVESRAAAVAAAGGLLE